MAKHLSETTLLLIHERTQGLRNSAWSYDPAALHSVLDRHGSSQGDHYETAASLAFDILTLAPFGRGQSSTAWLAATAYLSHNRVHCAVQNQTRAVLLMRSLAAGEISSSQLACAMRTPESELIQ